MNQRQTTQECPGCGCAVFVRANNSIVAHYMPDGRTCGYNEMPYPSTMTTKTEAPERVTLYLTHTTRGPLWIESGVTDSPDGTMYIRADLADAWRKRAERAEVLLTELRRCPRCDLCDEHHVPLSAEELK